MNTVKERTYKLSLNREELQYVADALDYMVHFHSQEPPFTFVEEDLWLTGDEVVVAEKLYCQVKLMLELD